MSLSMLLSLEYPLGEFIGMCGYMPFRADIMEAIADDGIETDEDNPFAVGDEDQTSPDDPVIKALIFDRDLCCLSSVQSPERENIAQSTTVFLGDGDADEKKPYQFGEGTAQTMQTAGYNVVWKLYQGLGY